VAGAISARAATSTQVIPDDSVADISVHATWWPCPLISSLGRARNIRRPDHNQLVHLNLKTPIRTTIVYVRGRRGRYALRRSPAG
jgi:hypothetical protein